jgi:phosphatidylserine decarboxylase
VIPDGFRYGAGLGAAAIIVYWLAGVWFSLPLVALALFVLYFFRDPERVIPSGPEPVLVSPADGRVVDIRDVEQAGAACRRISIFLSAFDVHVNRAPLGGAIQDVVYSPGRFLVAWRAEASTENERNTVTITGPEGTVVFRQIAGILARRIVFWKKKGDPVERGERVGLIKFGSRVDVFVDAGWELLVSAGARVRGGSSILARRDSHGQ